MGDQSHVSAGTATVGRMGGQRREESRSFIPSCSGTCYMEHKQTPSLSGPLVLNTWKINKKKGKKMSYTKTKRSNVHVLFYSFLTISAPTCGSHAGFENLVGAAA